MLGFYLHVPVSSLFATINKQPSRGHIHIWDFWTPFNAVCLCCVLLFEHSTRSSALMWWCFFRARAWVSASFVWNQSGWLLVAGTGWWREWEDIITGGIKGGRQTVNVHLCAGKCRNVISRITRTTHNLVRLASTSSPTSPDDWKDGWCRITKGGVKKLSLIL